MRLDKDERACLDFAMHTADNWLFDAHGHRSCNRKQGCASGWLLSGEFLATLPAVLVLTDLDLGVPRYKSVHVNLKSPFVIDYP